MTTVEKHTDDDEVGLEHAEEFARTHPGLVKFGRIGWVAKGVVYARTGFLALLIAFDRLPGAEASQSPGQEASQSGAIARIAERTGGVPLLLVIVAGLVNYSCWRIVSALLPADSDASSWITRIGYLVSAVTYLVLAGLAVSIASNHREAQTDASQKTEDSKVETFTRNLLGHSYGRTVVFLIGVVLICIAATFLLKAVTASFRSQMAHRGVGPISFDMLVLMGRIGWIGRTAMMGLIGFFLCRAAWLFNADEAQGLDGSLRKAATSDAGTVLVVVVAVGLLVYGLFCIISAPRQLLVAADR